MPFHQPPLDGSLTIPEMFDWHLSKGTDQTLFVFADDSRVSSVSWPQAIKAVYAVVRLIPSLFGERLRIPSVIGILAANTDSISFYTLIVGILRAGHRVFPISPRNSPEGIAHLLKVTQTRHLLISEDQGTQRLANHALDILSKREGNAKVALASVPAYSVLYNDVNFSLPPLPPMAHPDVNSTALFLHSSGSTAFPKAIPLTYNDILHQMLALKYGGTECQGEVWSCHSIPMFHAMGCIMPSWSAGLGLSFSVFPPDTTNTPNAESVLQAATLTSSKRIFCIPAFIETWAAVREDVETLASFSSVMYGGAPLKKEVGDALSQSGVVLCPFYGNTEIGAVATILPIRRPPLLDWNYFALSPHLNPLLIPFDEEREVYQIVLLKCPTHPFSVSNTKVNGVDAFDTNDLLERHPLDKSLWKVVGRADNQIMHSNGEKTNPGPIEDMITRDSHVAYALVFGREHFHAGVLVQPEAGEIVDPSQSTSLAAYRDKIWESVDEANQSAPAHSKIFKEMILVTNPAKPMLLTDKGTVKRGLTLSDYQDEIEAIYQEFETKGGQSVSLTPDRWDLESCVSFCSRVVRNVLVSVEVGEDDDIFCAGCDSLGAASIRRDILVALQSSGIDATKAPRNFVYTNPTIARLAQFLVQIVAGTVTPDERNDSKRISERVEAMKELVTKYTSPLWTSSSTPHFRSKASMEVVVITGSTGGLGSYLLEAVLRNKEVSRVYALNRRSRGNTTLQQRQEQSFRQDDIDGGLAHSPKLFLIEADFSRQDLGLDTSLYSEIRDSVTTFYHCGWQVDFNVGLESMEPSILATRNLIDLAVGSRQIPRFVFTSSVGVIGNRPDLFGTSNPSHAIGTGYSESKWVAEQILIRSMQTMRLQVLIARLGQLSGGRNGRWNTKEWFPLLVHSSQLAGCLPEVDSNVAWIPIHVAAQALIGIHEHDETFIHLQHPTPTPWNTLVGRAAMSLGVPLIPYTQWLERLRDAASKNLKTDQSSKEVLLLDFFQRVQLTSNVDDVDVPEQSGTLPPLGLAKLGTQDVDDWVAYWRAIGFLP